MTKVKLELELDADKLANVVTQMEDQELVNFLSSLKTLLSNEREKFTASRKLLQELNEDLTNLDWASWNALREFETTISE